MVKQKQATEEEIRRLHNEIETEHRIVTDRVNSLKSMIAKYVEETKK